MLSVGQSTALRARLELFSSGFNSAHGYLIEVTPHLFLGAAELPQASLDLTMVGQFSAFSNVSKSSYCSMAMRVATFADHWIMWADQMRIKSSEHLIRMRCERCQREVEFQSSRAERDKNLYGT